MTNPFGTTINADDVIDDLSFFDSWEDRYRYIIDLGKQLPPMDDALKTDDRLIPGCQSQVWLEPSLTANTLTFHVDSDAHIVRGLLAMVMAAYNNKSPQDILDFDIENYFAKIDLVKHLSPTRGNGLQAMVLKIQDIAQKNAA
ncbi:SufE family protein [Pleionea litopenaei]|uniref:SufE family protein n=1 Tax=Pleionea litopenaei TaxID=3070815 RepID=A0AA51RU91_9GAMM|nr:SufE family protein [Pleionea sp. HL-JVS1]WMS87598.1 SufE family protein [Pleionea sp. HL-JVS1]